MRSINRYDVAILASLALVCFAARGVGQQYQSGGGQQQPPPNVPLTVHEKFGNCKATTCLGRGKVQVPNAGTQWCEYADDKIKRGYCYVSENESDYCAMFIYLSLPGADFGYERVTCKGKWKEADDMLRDCESTFKICFTSETPTPEGVAVP